MKGSPHIIHRVNLDLIFREEGEAQVWMERWEDLFYRQMLPRLEELFDQADQSGHILQFEKLTLDLGTLDPEHTGEAWMDKISETVREQWFDALQGEGEASPDTGEPAPSPPRTLTPQRSLAEQLVYFLRTGRLAWNARNWVLPGLEPALADLFDGPDTAFAAEVRNLLLDDPVAVRRLIRQFSDAFLERVTPVLFPQRGPDLLLFRQSAEQVVIPSVETFPVLHRKMRNRLWEEIYQQLKSGPPLSEEGAREMVRRLASESWAALPGKEAKKIFAGRLRENIGEVWDKAGKVIHRGTKTPAGTWEQVIVAEMASWLRQTGMEDPSLQPGEVGEVTKTGVAEGTVTPSEPTTKKIREEQPPATENPTEDQWSAATSREQTEDQKEQALSEVEKEVIRKMKEPEAPAGEEVREQRPDKDRTSVQEKEDRKGLPHKGKRKDLTREETERPEVKAEKTREVEEYPSDEKEKQRKRGEPDLSGLREKTGLLSGEREEPIRRAEEPEKPVVKRGNEQKTSLKNEPETSPFSGSETKEAGAEEQPAMEDLPLFGDGDRPPVLHDWHRRREAETEGLPCSNAGLILLHPFLAPFFREFGLLDDQQQFGGPAAREEAMHLLQYLATGRTESAEFDLVLNKMLVGLEPEVPVDRQFAIRPEQEKEAEKLLKTVIGYWKRLGDVSPDSLREGFLLRNGKLTWEPNGWHLRVEHRTLDILLKSLPWNYALVQLPWLEELVWVEWE